MLGSIRAAGRFRSTVTRTPRVVQFVVVIIAIRFGCEPETSAWLKIYTGATAIVFFVDDFIQLLLPSIISFISRNYFIEVPNSL